MKISFPNRAFMFNYFLNSTKKNTLVGLLSLAIPVVFSEMSSIIMMLADRYFLSLLGGNYLSAVSVSSFALYAIFLVFWGTICMYTNAIVSQYFGAQQFNKCSLVVSQGVILAFVGYIVILLLIWLFHDFIFILGSQEENILSLEKEYFDIVSKASLFFLLQGVLSGFFIGIGKSYLVLICGLIGTLLNIPLNYILIFGKFGFSSLDVSGSAYATLISSVTTVILLSILYLRNKHNKFKVFNSFHVNINVLSKLIRFGLPSAVEKFINMATYNVFVQMVTSYSYDVSVAVSIAYTWNVITYVPLLGLGEAVVSLVGRSLGSKDQVAAREITRAGFKISFIYFSLIFIVFLFFSENIVNIFIHANSIHEKANIIMVTKRFIRIMIVALGFESLVIVLDGALRGAGDTKWIMRVTSIVYIFFVFLEYLAIKIFKMDYVFSYMGAILLGSILFLLLMKRYLGNNWLKVKIVSN